VLFLESGLHAVLCLVLESVVVSESQTAVYSAVIKKIQKKPMKPTG
jgi:hypothetical protein